MKELRHKNRIESRKATKSKFWCDKCDAALVGQLGKCPRCGLINGHKKQK